MNNLLSKILIQPNVVSDDAINFLIKYAQNNKKEKATVFDAEKTQLNQSQESKLDLNSRDVSIVDIEKIYTNIFKLYKNIVEKIINPFYNFKIRDSESPQFLVYENGGHYKPHNDGYAQWKNPDGSIIWKKTMDRDLSTILYLNSDFDGGELVFPELRINIRPEPGLLVCFPSTQLYVHGVEPVKNGVRYCIVNWMRVHGYETKDEMDKKLSSKYNIPVY